MDAALKPWVDQVAALYWRRATVAEIQGKRSTAMWYRFRRDSIRKPLAQRAGACGTYVSAIVHCTGCGVVHEVPARCKLRTACSHCAAQRAAKVQDRLARSLWSHASRLRGLWREMGGVRAARPMLTMLTLTLRHSGDVAEDLAALHDGWKGFRSWLNKRLGAHEWKGWGGFRRVRRKRRSGEVYYRSEPRNFAPPFALAVECVKGQRGDHHVHVHVATFLPRIDYRMLQEAWKRSTEGRAEIGPGLDVARFEQRRGASGASEVMAGYVSKGSALATYVGKGTQLAAGAVDEAGARLAAEWHAAQYGRHVVQGSYRFWTPKRSAECDSCKRDGRFSSFHVLAVGERAREIASTSPARSPPAPS